MAGLLRPRVRPGHPKAPTGPTKAYREIPIREVRRRDAPASTGAGLASASFHAGRPSHRRSESGFALTERQGAAQLNIGR